MLPDLPEILATERLLIRVPRLDEGEIFNAAAVKSLTVLSPWLAWATPTPSVAESEAFCKRCREQYIEKQDFKVFFFDKATGGLVGGSGLNDADWEDKKQLETGYWGNVEFSGQGLMTEGVKALAEYAIHTLKAKRVFLTVDALNSSSWKLAERAGFTLEGTLRNDRFNLKGKLRNTRVYSIIPSDMSD